MCKKVGKGTTMPKLYMEYVEWSELPESAKDMESTLILPCIYPDV